MPNPNVWFLLESHAIPGNFASVPAVAREATGVLGAGTEGGMAPAASSFPTAGEIARNMLCIKPFSCMFTPETLRTAHSLAGL